MAEESKAESEHLHKARGTQRSYRPRRSGRGRRGRAGRGQPPAPPRPFDQTATPRESPEASPMEAPPEGVEHENENVEPQGGGSETGEDMPNQTLPPAEAGEFEGEPAELEGGHEREKSFQEESRASGRYETRRAEPVRQQEGSRAPRRDFRPAEPAAVQKAIEEVNQIIDVLRDTIDEMEEVLETLELAERQKDADEREIESLRRSLRQIHRPREGNQQSPNR
jgi:hypothetical protein